MQFFMKKRGAVLYKFLALTIFGILLMGIGTYLLCRCITVTSYVSTARLWIVVPAEEKDESLAPSRSYNKNRIVETSVNLLKTDSFKQIIKENAHIDHEPDFSVFYEDDSTIVTIRARDNDPIDAYKVALAVSENANDFLSGKSTIGISVVIVDMPAKAVLSNPWNGTAILSIVVIAAGLSLLMTTVILTVKKK